MSRNSASYAGDEGIKTLVQITIHSLTLQDVTLSSSSSSSKKSLVSCCFQRGLKSVTSKEFEIVFEQGKETIITSFQSETLSLVTTLVRDAKNGIFHEKHSKIVIRLSKNGLLGFGSGYQGIAVAQLPLHTLLADYTPQRVTLSLVDCNGCKGGSVVVTLNPKFISEAALTVDNQNELSDSSDHSKSGLADFYLDEDVVAKSAATSKAAAHTTDALQAALLANSNHTKEKEKLLAELASYKQRAATADALQAELATSKVQIANSVEQSYDLITKKDAEIAALRASSGTSTSSAEVEDLKAQLQAAAEYVAYQENVISTHAQTIAALQSKNAPVPADTGFASIDELNALKAQLAAAAEYVAHQEEQIEALKSAPAVTATSQKQIQALQAQIAAAAEYVAHQESQIELLKTAQSVSPPATPSFKEEPGVANAKLKAATESIALHDSKMATISQEVEALMAQLAAAAEYVAYQESQVAALTAEVAQKEKLAKSASEEVAALKAIPAPAPAPAAQNLEEIEALKAQLAAAAEYVAYQESQVAALTAGLEESKVLVQQGADYVAYQEGQITALQTELESTTKSTEPTTKLAELQNRFAATEANLREHEERQASKLVQAAAEIEALKSQVQQSAETIAHQKTQLSATQSELEASRRSGSTPPSPSRLHATHNTDEFNALKAQLAAAAEYVAHQEVQIAKLTVDSEASSKLKSPLSSPSRSKTEHTSEEIEALKAQLAAAAEYVAHQEAQIATLTAGLEESKVLVQQGADYVAYQETVISAQVTEITALRAAAVVPIAARLLSSTPTSKPSSPDHSLLALEKKLETADAFINHQSAEIAKLQLQLGEGQQSTQYIKDLTSAEVQAQLEVAHKKAIEVLANEIVELKEAVVKKDTELALVREQFRESREESDNFKAARAILSRDIDDLNDKLKILTATLSRTEIALSDSEKKRAELESARDALANDKDTLANDKAVLAGEISVLQANLDAAKSFAFPSPAPASPMPNNGLRGEESLIVSSPMGSRMGSPINNKSREQEIAEFEREKAEHDEVIGNLIETKMALAINSSALDEERSKVIDLQRRLQAYTNKIAALEGRLNADMEKSQNNRSMFNFSRLKKSNPGGQRHTSPQLDDDDDL